MSKTPTEQLRWFWKHADMFLSDAVACPSQASPAFYWDTSDVLGALLGYSDFYGDKDEFRTGIFRSGTTLVRCLMAAGWFGRIHTTFPHQSEIITGITNLLRHGPKHGPPGGVDQFLKQALLTKATAPSQDDVNIDIKRLIRAQLAAAGDLFKAIQSIIPWKDRLQEWKEHRLILFQTEDAFDYEAALSTPQFAELQAAPSNERPDVPINNFTDAIALCHLEFLLRSALSRQQPLPIFFASDTSIKTAVDKLTDSSFLRYHTESGQAVSILRDVDYYFIRASLWPPPALNVESVESPIDLLRSMRDEIRIGAGVKSHDELSAVGELLDLKESLAEKIDELRRFWFLQRVWLPSAAGREFDAVVESYLADTRRLIDEERRNDLIRKDILDVRRQLDHGAKRYALVYELWSSMYEAVTTCHNRYANKALVPSANKVSGLIRFGFSNDLLITVQSDFEQIALSSVDRRRDLSNRLAATVYAYAYGKTEPELGLDRLVAVLWILKQDNYISIMLHRVLRGSSGQLSIPLYIVLGASLLRMGKPPSVVTDVILGLSKQLDQATSLAKKSQVMSGLAYLHFHSWLNSGGRPFWHPDGMGPTGSVGGIQLISGLLSEAIKWAKNATEIAAPETSAYAYALNQYIYYITEGGTLAEFRGIDRERDRLMVLQGNDSVWQYRFDDTLARYFHRLALIAAEADRGSLWNRALWYIERASSEGYGDEGVERYKGVLIASKARLSGP